jgi:phosphohistidine swiveling domain-containing protein
VTKAAFTMEEGFLADFTRGLVQEQKWRDALRILQEATQPALSLQACVDILTGKSTLVRDENGYRLAEQDPESAALCRYLNTVAWQQAGILDIDGEFYQPYARITSFGEADEEDVLATYRLRDGDWVSMEQYRKLRSMVYADSKDDIVRFDVSREPVLFRRVQGPAFWVTTFKEADEAFADYLKHRTLKETGHTPSRRDKSALLPDDWEFYFQAAREGFLLGDDDFLLKGKGSEHLEALLKLRDAFDQADYEAAREGAAAYDDDGVYRKDRLKDDYHMASLCLLYRVRILARAEVQGGFLNLRVGKGEDAYDLRVPRAPFLIWAQRGAHRTLADMQHWTPVCPLGMKMMADDPIHSDWWIGAGLDPSEAYEHSHPVNAAAWKFSSNLAYTEGRQCVRLAGKGRVTGAVVFPKAGEAVPEGTIAVVPNAGVDYELALMSACRHEAGAVIAAVGGKLAHLATVSRELGARLVVVDEAMTRFSEGDIVTLDLDEGQVTIHGKNSPFDDHDE